MTQEREDKDAEVADEATQAETSEPLEALQAQISQLTSALEEAKREAKSHQEYGRKTKGELDRQRGLDAKVSGLESKMEVVAEMVADLIDKGGAEEELEPQPPKRRSAEYRVKLKQPVVVPDPQRQEALVTFNMMGQRVEALGLTPKDPEYRQVYRLAKTLDPMDLADADEILTRLEAEKVVDTPGKPEAPVDIAKAVAAGVQAELKKLGLLSSDTGAPGAGATSVIEATRQFAEGEITAEEAKRKGVIFS